MSIKVLVEKKKQKSKKKYKPSFYTAKEERAEYLISKGVDKEIAYGIADKQMADKGKKKKDKRKNEEIELDLEQIEEKNTHHPKPGRNKKYFGSSLYDFGLLHGDSGADSGGDAGGGDGNRRKDPKVGTGKKPKGSGRRLYTDENPKDTVSVEFSSVSAIQKTLAKSSFKSKSHKRQSQIINLIHQRVRAAYNNAKDPEVKARLKKAYEYAKKRKEASKEKTKRMQKEKKK